MAKERYIIILIIALALILRIIGLNWGLPGKDYYFSYHSDETHYIRGLSQMNPRQLNFNPHYFNWGTFHYFELGLTITAASACKLLTLSKAKEFYYSFPQELKKIYLVGRLLSVLLSVLTIFLVYVIAKRIFPGYGPAVLAAFFLAVNPAHVVHAHYLKADSSVTFWLTLQLLACFCLLTYGDRKWYVLSGIFSALAIGAQQNGLCFIFTPLFAHLLREVKCRADFGKAFLSGKLWLSYFSVLPAYLIVSPYVILSPLEFLGGIKSVVLGQGGGVDVMQRSNLLVDTLNALSVGYTPAFLLLSLLGIVYGIRGKFLPLKLVAFWLLPYLTVLVFAGALETRFQMLIVPGLAILASGLVFAFLRRIRKIFFRKLFIAAIAVSSAFALIESYSYVLALSVPAIQQEASDWLMRTVPAGTRIGTARNPEIRNCPSIIHQSYYYPKNSYYKIINFDYNIEDLSRENAEYVVISKREGFDFPGRLPVNLSDFISALKKNFRVIKIFERYPSFFNVSLKPNIFISDWEIPFPVIYVLKGSI